MAWEFGVAAALIAFGLGLLLFGKDEPANTADGDEPAPGAPAESETEPPAVVRLDDHDDEASIHDTLVGELPPEIRARAAR